MFGRTKTVPETGENRVVVVSEFASLLKECITEVAGLVTKLAKDGDAVGTAAVAEALNGLIMRYQTFYHFR